MSADERISIHAPLAGRDVGVLFAPLVILNFNPRAPCGARRDKIANGAVGSDFNPRAPCGARRTTVCVILRHVQFQSTRPLRGATTATVTFLTEDLFQSTRPLRGATVRIVPKDQTIYNFNPRAPWGARHTLPTPTYIVSDFNPRAPCGARRFPCVLVGIRQSISIHAPLAGRDYQFCLNEYQYYIFQSTRPLRGATAALRRCNKCILIFQSTRPLRGATLVGTILRHHGRISIHAPLAGRDMAHDANYCTVRHFNPRAPCGARRSHIGRTAARVYNFNPRAPCGARR